ncbi:MAG: Wzz/FepE/Etk N-terminal domain-containing protein [Candidatus Omnitrophica bacterium]|nr:Wzz/FepE/Etk N-terminal domain-containing protein [Candidatus Omnitrophota bacterium]
MDQNSQNHEEEEIDLSQYIKTIVKRKKTLIVVFLLTLAIGFTYILFSPKMYRSSMLIQSPVVGPSLTGANDLDSAENLKGLIINNAFNDELSKRLKIDLGEALGIEFKVFIPPKTNILQVSVDLRSEKKEYGVVLLRNLNDVILDSYAKRIEAERAEIDSQVKFNERAIANAKEKSKNLEEQIKEVTARKDKLMEEIKLVSINTKQILEKCAGRTKGDAINEITENVSILLLSNFLQNNSSYLNQLNNQSSELTIDWVNLNLKLKITTSQISDFQMAIDKLKIKYNFISNLRTISQPRVSAKPLNSMGKKTLVILIAMGLFFGLLAVFLREFWLNNLVKK